MTPAISPVILSGFHSLSIKNLINFPPLQIYVRFWYRLCGAKVPNADQITFYTARHSFATILKKKGQSVKLISELLGHSDVKTTQIYLGSFDDATKDAALRISCEFPLSFFYSALISTDTEVQMMTVASTITKAM